MYLHYERHGDALQLAAALHTLIAPMLAHWAVNTGLMIGARLGAS